ncbi:hypothetical protein EDC01DRAFT_782321 [Geopyxis carbonaria]|nr:hypothetical protein EDC01DRAFT_782321 [Geopyxis carbonaria]
MSGVTYHLCHTPRAYKAITDELRGTFANYEDITAPACERLPYLNAVVHEGLRIFPPLQLQLQSLNLTFQDDKAHNATLLATALQQYADTTTCNLDLLPLCDPKTGADRIVNYHLHTLAYDLEPLEQIAVLLQLIGSSVLAEPFQLSLQTDIIPRARPVRVSPHSQLTPLLMILNAPFAATVDGFVTPHLLAAAETLARPATVWAVAVDNRGCQAWIFCTTVTPAKLRQIQVSAAKVLYGGGGFKVSGPATGTLLEVERVGPYEIRSRDGRRNFGAVLWEILRKVASDWIELH